MPKRASLIVIVAVVVGVISYLAASTAFPALLLFPYERTVGETRVYSEEPISGDIASVISASNQKLSKSAISEPGVFARPVFLTSGDGQFYPSARHIRLD